jgi:hypothetical protein
LLALIPTPSLGDWGQQGGLTQEDAVVITNVKNEHRLDETEEMWIMTECGRGKILSKHIDSVEGRQIEVVVWHGYDGRGNDSDSLNGRETDHTSYFDITNAYGK